MLFKKDKYSKNEATGTEWQESTEIWVADFGSHELEEELRREVLKLKPRGEIGFSWVLVSVVLLIFIVVTELLLRQLGLKMYWSETNIFWATWLWRLVIVVAWLVLARLQWLLSPEKMFVTTIISFLAAIIISGVIKIIYVHSVWAWLNLLVEPIWMLIFIVLLGTLIIKFSNKRKLIKN